MKKSILLKTSLKKWKDIMEKKYQITSYQLVYASGGRDTVKLFMPVRVDDLEKYRNSIRATHDCIGVNLTYTELP